MIGTDNTVLSNGIIKDNIFYPKKNLASGTLRDSFNDRLQL